MRINTITITGYGEIKFEYYSCIKIGDMAMNINADTDPICDEYGNIEIDVLSWDRIVNTPTTLSGYGISDAYPISSVYNKNEVDNKIKSLNESIKSTEYLASNIASDLNNNYYNKSQVDKIISDIDIPDIDISKLDTYTKAQIDDKLQNIIASGIDISEDELNEMLEEVLG